MEQTLTSEVAVRIPAQTHVETLDLDIVIPVYNEEAALADCVERLVARLATLPLSARITIADNASTDDTWTVAQQMTARYPQVQAVRLDAKGRGRALRQALTTSNATVVAYMDVDLSTDLDALFPARRALLSGHSDVAIGTRLSKGSRVVRGAKREFISRSYNLLLRTALRVRFSDAQCGFKAIRTDRATELLPLVQDNDWFFDTELLTLAERAGMRIHEVPVDWIDDPDSRVDIWDTATGDLRGIARLMRGFTTGRLSVDHLTQREELPEPDRTLLGNLVRFALVGVASTALFGLLSAVPTGAACAGRQRHSAVGRHLRQHCGEPTVHFRRARPPRPLAATGAGYAVLAIALSITSGALAVLHALTPDRGQQWSWPSSPSPT